jgi:putative DNA primase/helicase
MSYTVEPENKQARLVAGASSRQIPTTDAEWRSFARTRTTEDMVFIGAAYAIQWGLKRDAEKTAQISGMAFDSAEGLAEGGEARSAQANQDETLGFLERLRPGGPWVLTAIVPDGATATITARTEQEAAAFVRQHNGTKNLYYSVNPTRTPVTTKAKKADIAIIEYVYADCDPRKDETPEEGKNRILAARRTSALPSPTFVVDSGNGLQLIWRLAEPIVLPLASDPTWEREVQSVEARNKNLLGTLDADYGTQNIDRILRLPGTANLPNAKKVREGRVRCEAKLVVSNNGSHALAAFPELVDPGARGTGTGEGGGPKPNGADKPNGAIPLLSALTVSDRIKEIISTGKWDPPEKYKSRSEAVFAVAVALVSAGYSDAVIAHFISDPQWPISAHVREQPNPHRYLAAQIARARATNHPAPSSNAAKVADIVCAADIVMRPKDWLWEGHLLRGAQELLTGIPGLGKSQVQIHFVACVTAGLKWPDGAPAIAPANVIMLTAEDTLDQEVVPRLIAAGADLNRVHIIKSIRTDARTRRQFLLNEDLAELEKNVFRIGNVGLITIDPITAFMGSKIDSHKTTEVRAQLGPLKDFAERMNVAVSTITHPPKSAGQKAIDHFIGSQAFIAAGRIGHVCVAEMEPGEDEKPKPTGRILFANAKNNPHILMPTLAYRISETVVGQDADTRDNIAAPHVVWDAQPVEINADQAVAASNGAGKSAPRDAQERVQAFVREMLKDGPIAARKMTEEAGKRGITVSQLQTARAALGVEN